MSTTPSQNFEMYAGDSKNLIVTVTDQNGNVVNLTGATIKWKLTYLSNYFVVNATAGTLNKDTANGGVTVTNPTTGVFKVILSPTDTSSLQGSFRHGAELIDGVGNVSTIFFGVVKIIAAVV